MSSKLESLFLQAESDITGKEPQELYPLLEALRRQVRKGPKGTRRASRGPMFFQRKAKRVEEEWAKLQDTSKVDSMKRFVQMVGDVLNKNYLSEDDSWENVSSQPKTPTAESVGSVVVVGENGNAENGADEFNSLENGNGNGNGHDHDSPSLSSTSDPVAALERQLARRASREDLLQHNILKDGAHGSLSGPRKSLDMHLRRQSLEKKVEGRIDKERLLNDGILKGSASPPIAAKQEELKKKKVASDLERRLSNQPARTELEDRHIIVEPVRDSLEKQFRRRSLSKGLQARPEKDALVEKGVMRDDADPAIQAAQTSLGEKLVDPEERVRRASAHGLLLPAENDSKSSSSAKATDNSTRTPQPAAVSPADASVAPATPPPVDACAIANKQELQASLDGKLARRPSVDDLANRNVLTVTSPARLQSTAKTLEQEFRRHSLEKHVSHRPPADDLKRQNILRSDVSPAISSTQGDLARNMRRSSLTNALLKRPSKEHLTKSGIMHAGDAALQPTAAALVNKLTDPQDRARRASQHGLPLPEEDAVLVSSQDVEAARVDVSSASASIEGKLTRRPTVEHLRETGVVKEGNSVLQASRVAIEQEMTKSKLQRQIARRPTADTLLQNNILKTDPQSGVAPTLVQAQEDLARARTKHSLENKLQCQPDVEDLVNQNILHGTHTSSVLQSRIDTLNNEKRRGTISDLLESKPTREELADRKILLPEDDPNLPATPRCTPVLPAAASENLPDLTSASVTLALEKNLKRRPSVSEMQQRSILHDGTPTLQAKKRKLEREMNSDKLSNLLERRADRKSLLESNILKDERVAPSLQAAHEDLKRKMAAQEVNRHMLLRPDADDLKDRNVMPESGVAGSIQPQVVDLHKKLRRTTLNAALAAQPTKEDLVERGILRTGAPALQPAMAAVEATVARRASEVGGEKATKTTEARERRASCLGVEGAAPIISNLETDASEISVVESVKENADLAGKLARRPSKDRLEATNILKTGTPLLQDSTCELARAMHKNNLENKLANQPDIEELKQRNIMREETVAPNLQLAKDAMERHVTEKSLEGKLARRPTIDDLQHRHIVHDPHTAPRLVASKEAIVREQRSSSLSNFLKRRPSKDVLVERGIAQKSGGASFQNARSSVVAAMGIAP